MYVYMRVSVCAGKYVYMYAYSKYMICCVNVFILYIPEHNNNEVNQKT